MWGRLMPRIAPAPNCVKPRSLDDAVNPQIKMELELVAVGIGETGIGKLVAAASFEVHASYILTVRLIEKMTSRKFLAPRALSSQR